MTNKATNPLILYLKINLYIEALNAISHMLDASSHYTNLKILMSQGSECSDADKRYKSDSDN